MWSVSHPHHFCPTLLLLIASLNVLPSFIYAQKPNVEGTCDTRIDDALEGTIASPGFPNANYNNNDKCIYEILVPEGYRISFRSLWMDVEPRAQSGCTDLLAIFPSDDADKIIEACTNSTMYAQSTDGPKLRVLFESDDSVTGTGFAIEWKAFKPSDLPQTVDCDFDGLMELCPGWTQDTNDKMDWIINRGSTPSKYTGPDFDHTTGTEEGRYAFIEGSDQKYQDNAILFSPKVKLDDPEVGHYCLSFWFLNRADKDIKNLLGGKLYVMELINTETNDIYSTDELTGNEWTQVEIDVEPTDQFVQFGFDAQRGKNYKSDFAIDDIKLEKGPCVDMGGDSAAVGEEDYENYEFNLLDIACTDEEHECDGLCLPKDHICNGLNDCSDGSDELNCPEVTCPGNLEFNNCASHCNFTCDDDETGPSCDQTDCVSRCACPSSLPVFHNGRCIDYYTCPPKIAGEVFDGVEDFQITDVNAHEATLQFTHVAGVDSYRIEFGRSQFPQEVNQVEKAALQNPLIPVVYQINLQNLAPAVEYQVKIFSIKNSQEKSSQSKLFTTNSETTQMVTTTVEQTTTMEATTATARQTTARQTIPMTSASKDCRLRVDGQKEGTLSGEDFSSLNRDQNIDCLYEVEVELGSIIGLNGEVNMPAPSGNNCSKKIQISLSGYEEDFGEEMCGEEIITPRATISSRLLIRYVSDSSSSTQDFRINWKSINLSQRQPVFNCSFDEPIPLCAGWQQEFLDTSDWLFSRSLDPRQPTKDHTTDDQSGRFAYAFWPQNTESVAVLTTPEISFTSQACFSIAAFVDNHMHINVEIVKEDGTETTMNMILSGSDWEVHQSELTDYVGPNELFKVRIISQSNGFGDSNAAIDDVSITFESCPDTIDECALYGICGDDDDVFGNYFELFDTTTQQITSEEPTTTEQSTTTTAEETTTMGVSGPCYDTAQQYNAQINQVDDPATKQRLLRAMPKCTPDGFYLPRQCIVTNCSCYTPNGFRIPATTHSASERFDCEALTQCQSEFREMATNFKQNEENSNFPECDKFGNYKIIQCDKSDGQCHCVIHTNGMIIPGKSSNDNTTLECSERTKCQKQFVGVGLLISGNWIDNGLEYPSCEPSTGLYTHEQCNSFASVCHCVDIETGDEFPGSENPLGQDRSDDCEAIYESMKKLVTTMANTVQTTTTAFAEETTTALPVPSGPCYLITQQVLQQINAMENPAIRSYMMSSMPNCTSDGFYLPRQCMFNNCSCMTPNGFSIPGTSHSRDQQFDCEDLTQCQQEFRVKASSYNPNEVDPAFAPVLPACEDDNGEYKQVQCNDFVGQCDCVIPTTGTKIPGKSTDIDKIPDCSELTACQKQFMQVDMRFSSDNPPMDGPEYPTCEPSTGLYTYEQCNSFANVCHCVDIETGIEFAASENPLGQPRSDDCEDIYGLMKKLVTTMSPTTTFSGETTTISDETTTFSDETTTFTDETTTAVPRPAVTGPCYEITQQVMQEMNKIISPEMKSYLITSMPNCTSDGFYLPHQCILNNCSCLTPNGFKVPGTSHLQDEAVVDCEDLTPCQREFNEKASGYNPNEIDPAFSSPTLPNCDDESGNYNPVQCDSSTYECNCVIPTTGMKIPGPGLKVSGFVPTEENKPDCTKLTACQREFMDVGMVLSSENPPMDGPEYPTCEPSTGLFTYEQCNSFANVCHCVDIETGIEYSGSENPLGLGREVSCEVISEMMNRVTTSVPPTTEQVTTTEATTPDEMNNVATRNYTCREQRQLIEAARGMQDGATPLEYPKCNDEGNFETFQCADLSVGRVCSCVQPAQGQVFEESITPISEGNTIDCSGCEHEGAVYSRQTSSCDVTCDNLNPICTLNFVSRCHCPFDKPVLHEGRCVTVDECSDEALTTQIPIDLTTAHLSYDDLFAVHLIDISSDEAAFLIASSPNVTDFIMNLFQDETLIYSIPITRNNEMMRLIINELNEETNYRVVVEATTVDGEKIEKEKNFTTLEMEEEAVTYPTVTSEATTTIETEAPLDIQVLNMTNDHTDLLIFGGSDFNYYEILTYMNDNERPSSRMIKRIGVLTPLRLGPLSEDSKVVVHGLNGDGQSTSNKTISFKTKSLHGEGVPTDVPAEETTGRAVPEPLDDALYLQTKNITDSSSVLFILGGADIVSYMVLLYSGDASHPVTEYMQRDTSITIFTFKYLASGTDFNIVVRATMKDGSIQTRSTQFKTTGEKQTVTTTATPTTAYSPTTVVPTTPYSYANHLDVKVGNISDERALLILIGGTNVESFDVLLYMGRSDTPQTKHLSKTSAATMLQLYPLVKGTKFHVVVKALDVDGSFMRSANASFETTGVRDEDESTTTQTPTTAMETTTDWNNFDLYVQISNTTETYVDIIIIGGDGIFEYQVSLSKEKVDAPNIFTRVHESDPTILRLQPLSPGTQFTATVYGLDVDGLEQNSHEISFTTPGEEPTTTTRTPTTEGGRDVDITTTVQVQTSKSVVDDYLDVQLADVGDDEVDMIIFGGDEIVNYQITLFYHEALVSETRTYMKMGTATMVRMGPLFPGSNFEANIQGMNSENQQVRSVKISFTTTGEKETTTASAVTATTQDVETSTLYKQVASLDPFFDIKLGNVSTDEASVFVRTNDEVTSVTMFLYVENFDEPNVMELGDVDELTSVQFAPLPAGTNFHLMAQAQLVNGSILNKEINFKTEGEKETTTASAVTATTQDVETSTLYKQVASLGPFFDIKLGNVSTDEAVVIVRTNDDVTSVTMFLYVENFDEPNVNELGDLDELTSVKFAPLPAGTNFRLVAQAQLVNGSTLNKEINFKTEGEKETKTTTTATTAAPTVTTGDDQTTTSYDPFFDIKLGNVSTDEAVVVVRTNDEVTSVTMLLYVENFDEPNVNELGDVDELTSVKFAPLPADTNYRLEAQALLSNGSVITKEISFKTEVGEPTTTSATTAPTDITTVEVIQLNTTITEKNTTEMPVVVRRGDDDEVLQVDVRNVTTNQVLVLMSGSNIISYKVQLYTENSIIPKEFLVDTTQNVTILSLEKLPSGTKFLLRVKAHLSDNSTQNSVSDFITLEDKPETTEAPTITSFSTAATIFEEKFLFSVKNVTDNSAVLVLESGPVVNSYKLRVYLLPATSPQEYEIPKQNGITDAVMNNLPSNSRFVVIAEAISNNVALASRNVSFATSDSTTMEMTTTQQPTTLKVTTFSTNVSTTVETMDDDDMFVTVENITAHEASVVIVGSNFSMYKVDLIRNENIVETQTLLDSEEASETFHLALLFPSSDYMLHVTGASNEGKFQSVQVSFTTLESEATTQAQTTTNIEEGTHYRTTMETTTEQQAKETTTQEKPTTTQEQTTTQVKTTTQRTTIPQHETTTAEQTTTEQATKATKVYTTTQYVATTAQTTKIVITTVGLESEYNFQIGNISDTSATLTVIGGSDILFYDIFINNELGEVFREMTLRRRQSVTNMPLTDLTSDSVYLVVIRAVDRRGSGKIKKSSFKTLELVLPVTTTTAFPEEQLTTTQETTTTSAEQTTRAQTTIQTTIRFLDDFVELQVSKVTSNSVQVNLASGSDVRSFLVSIMDNNNVMVDRRRVQRNSEVEVLFFDNLEPASQYMVRAGVIVSDGSYKTREMEFFTHIDIDDSLEIEARAFDDSAEIIVFGGEDLLYYHIALFTDNISFPYVNYVLKEANLTTVMLISLPQASGFNVSVRGIAHDGSSTSEQSTTFETKGSKENRTLVGTIFEDFPTMAANESSGIEGGIDGVIDGGIEITTGDNMTATIDDELDFKVMNIEKTEADLLVISGDDVIMYEVLIFEQQSSLPNVRYLRKTGTLTRANMQPLIPGSNYTVEVRGMLNDGTTRMERMSFITVSEEGVSTPAPTDDTPVAVTPIMQTLLKVELLEVSKDYANVVIYGSANFNYYDLVLYVDDVDIPRVKTVRRLASFMQERLSSLKPGAVHTVMVRGVLNDGSSVNSKNITFIAKEDDEAVRFTIPATSPTTAAAGTTALRSTSSKSITVDATTSGKVVKPQVEFEPFIFNVTQSQASLAVRSSENIRNFDVFIYVGEASEPKLQSFQRTAQYTQALFEPLASGTKHVLVIRAFDMNGVYTSKNVSFQTQQPGETTTKATMTSSQMSTAADVDDSLLVQIVNIEEKRAELVIYGGSDLMRYDVMLFVDGSAFPHTQTMSRMGRVTQATLRSLSPGANHFVMVQAYVVDGSTRGVNTSFVSLMERQSSTSTPLTTTDFDSSLFIEMANIRDTDADLLIYGGSEVMSYDVFLYAESSSFPRERTISRETVVTTKQFHQLFPGTLYTVIVRASISDGNMKSSNTTFTTTGQKPTTMAVDSTAPAATTQAGVTATSMSEMSVEVMEIGMDQATLRVFGSSNLIEYELLLYVEGLATPNIMYIKKTGDITSTLIRPLRSNSNYRAVVMATANDGSTLSQTSTFTTKSDPDETTTRQVTSSFTTGQPSQETTTDGSTSSSIDSVLKIHLAFVNRDDAGLVILSGDELQSFEVSLFSEEYLRPIVQMVARAGRFTSVRLSPLAAGTNFTAVVKSMTSNGDEKEAKVAFETTADPFDVLRVDDETACVRIWNKKDGGDSFTIALDRANADASEGFSDDFQTVNAMKGPFTYACFYDLEPDQKYNFNVVPRRSNGVVMKRVEKQLLTDNFDPNAKNIVEYPENEDNMKWREQYNKWRAQTFITWAQSFISYQLQVAQILDLKPHPEACSQIVRPRCLSVLELLVDYNGCMFFVCNNPPKQGGIYRSEVNAYKLDNEVFSSYLLPQWQSLMEQYSKERSKL